MFFCQTVGIVLSLTILRDKPGAFVIYYNVQGYTGFISELE